MKGKLIVLEGGDGSGKSTQLELLSAGLRKKGFDVVNIHFPKHESRFGKVVDAYLRGELGSKDILPPEFIAMLYISDFYESKKAMEEMLEQGKMIVLSRYFSSTLTYQVALEKNNSKKDGLWNWVNFVCSRLPQPDMVLVLDVPLQVSKKFLENVNRAEGYKKGSKKDQHETDMAFQQAIRVEYERNIIRNGWKRIKCSENNSLLSIEEIHARVWKEVEDCLSEKPRLKPFMPEI